jgi:hypothetical protein
MKTRAEAFTMVEKPKRTPKEPPAHTDETGSGDRGRQHATDRPRPAEPFEECGPSGGYGGAGTEDETKDED